MEVILVDDQKPEVTAMLMALYSRSPKSVREHLEVVRKRGPEKFMAQFYVGYGHKSIGDCGSTSIFVQYVSMLAAKVVQDSPLYNGQEASTRYIDMTIQPVLNPLKTLEGGTIQQDLMALYTRTIEAMVPILKERHPIQADEDPKEWEKAIKARAFDISRGLIPAGATTMVGWHSTLRHAADHLMEMRNHPLPEMPEMAGTIEGELKREYPASFGHKLYEESEHYVRRSMERFAYFDDPSIIRNGFECSHRLDRAALKAHANLLSTRPVKTELHQRFRQYGTLTWRFPLDFGSYRDLQRQRSAIQEMPLLTTKYGFHPWYLEQMPAGTLDEIKAIEARVERLPTDELTKQYYTAMGYLVPVQITCPLPAAVYIAELRSGITVHPTLRGPAQRMGDVLKSVVPELAMHHDTTPDRWTIKRGAQDIVQKM